MPTITHKSPWLTVEFDADAKAGTLKLNGTIGSLDWSGMTYKEMLARRAEQFQKDLEALAALQVDELTIEISSLGGSFQHALAMHDYLAQFPGKVTTRVVGMTASAATIIAQAGNNREISANAMYLIHRASVCPYGNVHDLEEALQGVKQIDQRMVEIYAKRSGKPEAEVLALMDENTGRGRWLSGAQALEMGLGDSTFEPMDAAASAVPDGLDFEALGLPELPPAPDAPEQTSLSSNEAHQTPQQTEQTTTAKATATGSKPMLTTDQLTKYTALFGAEAAVTAMTSNLSYEDAVLQGAEAQAKALTEATAQIKQLTEAEAKAKADLATANAQIESYKQGLTDPLESSDPGNTGEAEANAEKAAKDAEAKADAEKRSAANDYLSTLRK